MTYFRSPRGKRMILVNCVWICAAGLLGFGAPCQAKSSDQRTVTLYELRPVSKIGNAQIQSAMSMGGVAYTSGIRAGKSSTDGCVTYAIPPRMKSFVCDVGVVDTQQPDAQHVATFRILIDGVDAPGNCSGELRNMQLPQHVVLDVTGKKSICFMLTQGAGIGDPMFRVEPVPGASEGGGGQGHPGKAPLLTSPADKAQVSGDNVMLRWQPVEGATSYGISIVSFKSNDPAGPETPRIWSAMAKGTSYSFKLSELPTGEYLWSVIAFGPTKPLGGFSTERVFALDR
jgi:hypothetical protein